MEIVTKQSLVTNVSKRFRHQYYDNGWSGHTRFRSGLTAEQAYRKLLDAKSEQDVLEAVGSISWIENKCHECGLDSDVVIILGEEPDYESNTAQICPSCIKKAMDLVSANR
jgi:hypothetical protein